MLDILKVRATHIKSVSILNIVVTDICAQGVLH